MASSEIPVALPPWKLRADVYTFPFWTTPAQVDEATAAGITYSPLEGRSEYASERNGRPVGGIGMIQILRYSDSPVGPYDEFILSPGQFEYEKEENGKRVKKRNNRITRIYVSQKHTCWNGRKNWNIPKHLAKFDFKKDADGTLSIKVFPHDTTSDSFETEASKTPLFQARFKTIPYVPAFPSALSLLKYAGYDLSIVHPPTPQGESAQGELVGTERWCSVIPGQYSSNSNVGWFDLNQGEGEAKSSGPFEHFWPGLGRWRIGISMMDTEVDFPDGIYWDPPKSVL